MVPNIVAKYDDANNLYPTLSNRKDVPYQQSEQTIQDPPMTNYRLDGEQFVIEDPAEYLESLGHTILNGRCKSKSISKKMIESRTLKVYNLSVTKALKKCAHLSKPAILAELQQILDKEV